jgi:hypothetical protein
VVERPLPSNQPRGDVIAVEYHAVQGAMAGWVLPRPPTAELVLTPRVATEAELGREDSSGRWRRRCWRGCTTTPRCAHWS